MKLKETIKHYQTMFLSDCGNYKVVKYGDWHAYFKPTGWKAFGNSCEKVNDGWAESKQYTTSAKAMTACRRHHKKFNGDLYQYNRL